jgi:ATP-dependent DNA helicase RecG
LSEDGEKRLRVMESTNDGFRIAEADLEIRGPGDFLGTRQAGLPDFRVANILRDGRILEEARKEAFALVEQDPGLKQPQHAAIREELARRWGGRLELAGVA